MAPSQNGLVAREHPESTQRELVALKWGWVPHWATDTKVGCKKINARSETAASKPAFRDNMKNRRCLVAAAGWYEWQVTPAGKGPTVIQRVGVGGEVMPVYFAGLWANWRPKDQPDADRLETFTILTREVCPELQVVHNRMPVVLPVNAYSAWLDRTMTSSATAAEMLSAAVVEAFHHYPVSTMVNTPKNDRPECMAAAVVGE